MFLVPGPNPQHSFPPQLLQNDVPDPECGQLLGELMFQSHASYGRLGLGSEGTDTLVAIVKATQVAWYWCKYRTPLAGVI